MAKVKFHLWHLFHIWHSQGVKSKKRWPVVCTGMAIAANAIAWNYPLPPNFVCVSLSFLSPSLSPLKNEKKKKKKKIEEKTCPSRFGEASHPMNLFIIKYNFKNAKRTLLYWRHFLYVVHECMLYDVWLDHRWLLDIKVDSWGCKLHWKNLLNVTNCTCIFLLPLWFSLLLLLLSY